MECQTQALCDPDQIHGGKDFSGIWQDYETVRCWYGLMISNRIIANYMLIEAKQRQVPDSAGTEVCVTD
jgi:hypothetical protein